MFTLREQKIITFLLSEIILDQIDEKINNMLHLSQ